MTFKSNLTQHPLYNNKDNISFSEKTQTNGIENRFHSKINDKAQVNKSSQSKVPLNFLGTRSVSKQATSNSNVIRKRGAPLIITPNTTGKMNNSPNSILSKGSPLPAITEEEDGQGLNAQQREYAKNVESRADKILSNGNKIFDVKEDDTIDFMPQTQDGIKYYLDREITYQKTAHNSSPNPGNLKKNIQDMESTNSDSDMSEPEAETGSHDSKSTKVSINITKNSSDPINRVTFPTDFVKKPQPKIKKDKFEINRQNFEREIIKSRPQNHSSVYIIQQQTIREEDKYPEHGLTSSLDTGTTTPLEKAPDPNSNGSPLEALLNQRKDIGPLQLHNASDFLKETTQNSSLSTIPEETSDLSSDEFSSEPSL